MRYFKAHFLPRKANFFHRMPDFLEDAGAVFATLAVRGGCAQFLQGLRAT